VSFGWVLIASDVKDKKPQAFWIHGIRYASKGTLYGKRHVLREKGEGSWTQSFIL
jgi:hypothetical protein